MIVFLFWHPSQKRLMSTTSCWLLLIFDSEVAEQVRCYFIWSSLSDPLMWHIGLAVAISICYVVHCKIVASKSSFVEYLTSVRLWEIYHLLKIKRSSDYAGVIARSAFTFTLNFPNLFLFCFMLFKRCSQLFFCFFHCLVEIVAYSTLVLLWSVEFQVHGVEYFM